ncbi:MAG: hypothetical protein LQ348_001593 [Seirophora lacunosa]|nr:MAG: hypothetical protein LQ348_001593 [Seirophora lacunosa]
MARGRPSASKSTPLKRALSPESKTLTPPSRQSKRLKSSPVTSSAKVTPKKSQFFTQESTASAPASEIEDEASGYEDEDEDAFASAISSPPHSESEEEEEYVSSEEEDRKTKRRKQSSGRGDSGKKKATNGVAVTAKAIIEKEKELWRPGVKSDLAPGEQVFIKLPKARGDGGIKYEDGVIHPNTLLFLGDLKENNDREWLKIHDAEYRQSKKDWDAFVEKMTEKMTELDETIPELPAKDLVRIDVQASCLNPMYEVNNNDQTFRIYRDVRFSPDQTPYKVHIQNRSF